MVMMCQCVLLWAIVLTIVGMQPAIAQDDRRTAMAIENVTLAESFCGVELTTRARELVADDKSRPARRFGDERDVLANLWRRTFACDPAYAGENCFVARWQMCQRTYEEYGPHGIRVKGLIAAIVKK